MRNEEKEIDLEEALKFGNQGVDNNKALFKSMMEADIGHGCSSVISQEKIKELKGSIASPMNIKEQSTIDELGDIILKKR